MPPPCVWKFTEVLKALRRRQRGLSLEALAYLAGVDQATISRIERGLTEPRRDTVVRLARGLGISAKRMAAIVAEAQSEEVAS
jgi:transcriptional regulator with XRE-family HTH domain